MERLYAELRVREYILGARSFWGLRTFAAGLARGGGGRGRDSRYQGVALRKLSNAAFYDIVRIKSSALY